MAKLNSSKDSSTPLSNKKRKADLKPKKQSESTPQSKKLKIKKKPLKPKLIKQQAAAAEEDPIIFGSKSESDSDSSPKSPTSIHSLIEPYTKPQLISFLLDAAVSDPELRSRIRSLADSDVSHRKIFVHGLSWDSTKETLAEAFTPFGPIEDCNLIVDKLTGRSKGYGFVIFKSRSATLKALKEPQKMIKNRMASCQLASIGAGKPDGGSRRIYVSNVPWEASAQKLKDFFAKFGEIETGPIGFDMATGKSRGYAIFVYKNFEDAKKVLEEPHKLFEGHNLHCKIATASGEGQKAGFMQPVQQAVPAAAVATPPQPVLAAVAAAQNLALLGQNPAYAALLAQNPLLAAAALNPGLWNAAAFGGAAGMGYGGAAGAPSSVLGTYGAGQGTSVAGFPGLMGYQAGSSSQGGQNSQGGNTGGGGYNSSFM